MRRMGRIPWNSRHVRLSRMHGRSAQIKHIRYASQTSHSLMLSTSQTPHKVSHNLSWTPGYHPHASCSVQPAGQHPLLSCILYTLRNLKERANWPRSLSSFCKQVVLGKEKESAAWYTFPYGDSNNGPPPFRGCRSHLRARHFKKVRKCPLF